MGTTGEESPPPARRGIGGKRRRWTDGGEEEEEDDEYVVEEDEEEEDYAADLSASSAGEDGEGSDAEYQEEAEEEEDEIETPRPKRPAKGSDRGRKGKVDPAAARSRSRRKYEDDDDYEEEEANEDDEGEEYHDVSQEVEEEEEEEEEMAPPGPNNIAKCGARGRDVKLSPEAKRSHQRNNDDEDMDFDPELDDELDEDTDFDPDDVDGDEEDEYQDEEEEELASTRARKVTVKNLAKRKSISKRRTLQKKKKKKNRGSKVSRRKGASAKVKKSVSVRRRRKRSVIDDYENEDDDDDFIVDDEAIRRRRKRSVIDDYDNEDDDDDFIVADEIISRRRKRSVIDDYEDDDDDFTVDNEVTSRRRKRSVIDDYEDEDVDEHDDDDFIVDDVVTENRRPRKKARTGTGRVTVVEPQVNPEEKIWPDLESEKSEFEFATSDEEPNDVETPVVEQIVVRKGRKKRISGSESSSDSEFVISDKELEELREPEPPKAAPILPAPLRRICITRHGEGKGKEKQEPEEAGNPICGICLTEEQRATVQGVLNCCSHYFCFVCIMEWSRVESRCPLCKQRFTTITKSSKVDLGLGVRKAVIKVEERDQVYQPTEEEIRRWLDPYENVVCIECNQGGDDSLMLLCDICDSSAHTYCVGLGREVPEGNWYCGGCRLGDEGPSYTGIQRTVAYERQNYRNHVDSSSVSFGMAAPSGTFERLPSINPRHSFQGIDLNLSPREFPGESHPAESQVSTDSVSTPTGRTLSGRRQIQQYIRILLARPRPHSRADVYHNIAQHSGGVPRTEPSRRNIPSSSEANTSQDLPDGIQSRHSGLPFVQAHSNFSPFVSLDGDDFQQIEGVKSNLRNM